MKLKSPRPVSLGFGAAIPVKSFVGGLTEKLVYLMGLCKRYVCLIRVDGFLGFSGDF